MENWTRTALLAIGTTLVAGGLTAVAAFAASTRNIAVPWWVLATLLMGAGVALVVRAWPAREPRAGKTIKIVRKPRKLVVENIQNHTIEIKVRNWRNGSVVRVTDPTGVDFPARMPEPFPESWIGSTLTLSFPNGDFPPSQPPLRSGPYIVKVREPRMLPPRTRLVAKGTVTIPEGLPGWFVNMESTYRNDVGNFVTIYTQPTRGSMEVNKALCSIWEPGKRPDHDEARTLEVEWQPGQVLIQAHYPIDFEGASLRHGVYNGTWMFWSQAAPVGGVGRWDLIRRFWFRWPDWAWGETDPP